MDTDPDHDRDKKAEKAAVLLALAADPGEAAGPCLTAEAMAALVDGRVKAPASAAYLAHLGGCGRCYEEWLLLKKERDLGTPRRRVYDLHRLKKISYIGSALAVAASIAVYLNVGNMAEQPLEQAVPGTVLMTDHAVGPAPQSQTPEKKKQEQGQPPARQNGTGRTAVPAAPAIVGEQALGRPEAVPAPPAERDQPSGAQRAKRIAAPAPPAGKVAEETASAPVDRSAISAAAPGNAEMAEWLEQLREACLAERHGADFWAEMTHRGERLRPGQSTSLTAKHQQRLTTVLTLLQAMSDPASESLQCRLILAELAKEGGTR